MRNASLQLNGETRRGDAALETSECGVKVYAAALCCIKPATSIFLVWFTVERHNNLPTLLAPVKDRIIA